MIAQSASSNSTSNVVYLPARRHRPIRHDAATISGQCRIAEAEKAYRSALAANPRGARALLGMANIFQYSD